MNMGQWDGSNHRIEADSNRPFKIYSYNTSGGIALGISGNDKLTINGDGSGIDVTGTVTADGLDVDTGDAGNGLNYGFDVKNAASGSATSYAMPAISWSNGGLRWASVHGERNPVGGYGGSFVVNTMNPAGSAVKRLGIDLNGDISFYEDTGTTPKFFWDASAEDLQIGGNLLNLSGVSSGTTGARLSANGGGMLRLASGGVDALYVVDGGNVGIGTDNPTAKVQINNAADSRLIIFETGTSPYTSTLELASQGLGTYGATVQYTSSAERLTLENYGRTISAASYSGSIAFKTKLNNTTPTEVMFIHGFTGNVGIGTSSPLSDLHVKATSVDSSNGLRLEYNTGTPYYSRIKQHGNDLHIMADTTNTGGTMRFYAATDNYVDTPIMNLNPAGVGIHQALDITYNDIGTAGSTTENYANSHSTKKYFFRITADGAWRKVLGSFNDTFGSFTATVSDTASGDVALYTYRITSPIYGVSSFSQTTYTEGGWNTGTFAFRIVAVGNSSYQLECQYQSYYSSANTGLCYMTINRS
jgi:hypothetical protein